LLNSDVDGNNMNKSDAIDKENYIPGEPIFTGDIDIPGMTEETLRYHLKKLTDSGSISLTGVYLVTFSIVGPILGPLFDKYNLHRKNLSRMLEDTGTVFSPIIPWSNISIFILGTLGVSSFEYATILEDTWIVAFPAL